METSNHKPGGFIQPASLRELWLHTGTICNLSCRFCLEGSRPGDKRIAPLEYSDAKPFIDEALHLNVAQFCFTGGEPFVIKDIIKILDYTVQRRPCLVLTNATTPLQKRMPDVVKLLQKPYPLRFRVSLDYPEPEKHDAGRGEGNFREAIETMGQLFRLGFPVSLARRQTPGEQPEQVQRAYQPFLASVGLPPDLPVVVFPELHPPFARVDVPTITEHCMTTYQTEQSRANFMCSYSKMILKKDGRVAVYPCTLVDDDDSYDLGSSLAESMQHRIFLKHHRCYSCFRYGTSCSEAQN